MTVADAGDESLTALLLVRVAGPHAGRRLAGWMKAGLRGWGVVALDNRDLAAELERLRRLVKDESVHAR
jgi:hypothetical protein